jgi:hypothetical protein
VRYCIAACYAGGALGVLVLLAAPASLAGLVLFATVYGLTRGAQSFVTSLEWADYFGRPAHGAIRGLASPFRHLAAAAGPVVGGVLHDLTGDDRLAFGHLRGLVPGRRGGRAGGRAAATQRGSIRVSGSRLRGSGFSVPTPCSRTSRTTASLNGVLTPTRRPCSTT